MVNTAWISNVANDSVAKAEFIAYLTNNQRLLTRLQEILELEEHQIYNTERSLDAYISPSWAYRQAHLNGKLEMLNFIKKLITIN